MGCEGSKELGKPEQGTEDGDAPESKQKQSMKKSTTNDEEAAAKHPVVKDLCVFPSCHSFYSRDHRHPRAKHLIPIPVESHT